MIHLHSWALLRLEEMKVCVIPLGKVEGDVDG
jgi:hypothetical protein